MRVRRSHPAPSVERGGLSLMFAVLVDAEKDGVQDRDLHRRSLKEM